MPFGKTRTAATYAREILRSISQSEIAENAVVDGTLVPLNADGRRIIETGTVMVYVGVNEIDTLTLTNATGGTFTLTYNTHATSAIPFDATAAAVQAALEGLVDFAPGDVLVTGPAGGPWTIEFTGTFAGTNVGAVTADGTNLTGSTPAATITTTTGGSNVPAVGQKVRPAPASGIASGAVAGILMHTTEFWTDADLNHADDEPVALFTKNCHFAADQLTGYSGNATAVKAAMTGAGNGRCANCTFES